MKNLLVFIFIALMTFSCASINKTKYSEFQKTFSELNLKTELFRDTTLKNSRDWGVQKLAFYPNEKPSEIFISLNGYSWSMDKAPLYIQLQRAKLQLISMNNLMASYLDFLVAMSGGEIKSKEELNKLADDLNKNSTLLAKNLKLNDSEKQINILSSVAVTVFETYLDKKREKFLAKAIFSNQAAVEVHSKLSIELLRFIKVIITNSYSESFRSNMKNWSKNESKLNVSKSLFDLNDNFIKDIENLSNIEQGLLLIPEVHQDLSKDEKVSKVDSLKRLSKRIQELQKKFNH